MKQFFIVLVFIAAFNSNTIAQNFELGKVSKSELEEKTYANDTSAPAAILFNKAKTSFKYYHDKGFVSVTEFEIRIKIYKKEGLRWANFDVPYYVGWEKIGPDNVEFSKGVTYNLVNGQIEKTKLDNQGTFKENINKYWKQKSIVLPNVKVGSILEFRYIKKSENIVRLPDFKFQYEIPVRYSEYISEIPEMYIYNEIVSGFLKIQTERKVEQISQSFTSEYNTTKYLQFRQIKTIHKIENVTALKPEKFVNNIDNYRSAIEQELKLIRYPDQPDKKYAESWEDVATDIYKSDDFGKQIATRQYFEAELKPYIQNITSQQERADAVLKFVKAKLKWDGNFGAYTRKGVKQCYLDRTGNVAEINFILISMLSYSGILAYPVVLSTRNNGISLFPNRTAFNYVIAAAEIDGKRVLLDATETFSDANILPFHALNWTGRLIRENGTNEEIELLPKTASRSVNTILFKIQNDGSISGKARIQKLDYFALEHRQNYHQINRDSYLEKLENDYGKIEISDYVIENENDLKKAIVETFNFTSNNNIEKIGDKMYLNPMLFFTKETNPFKQEEREYPIDFGFPSEQKYNFSIEIPEGYTIESLPKSINLGTEGQLGNFKYSIATKDNKIQLSVVSTINVAIVNPDYYQTIKDFFQKSIEKQSEKICLKKL